MLQINNLFVTKSALFDYKDTRLDIIIVLIFFFVLHCKQLTPHTKLCTYAQVHRRRTVQAPYNHHTAQGLWCWLGYTVYKIWKLFLEGSPSLSYICMYQFFEISFLWCSFSKIACHILKKLLLFSRCELSTVLCSTIRYYTLCMTCFFLFVAFVYITFFFINTTWQLWWWYDTV